MELEPHLYAPDANTLLYDHDPAEAEPWRRRRKWKRKRKVGGRAWPLKRRPQSPGEHGRESSEPHEGYSGVAAQAV